MCEKFYDSKMKTCTTCPICICIHMFKLLFRNENYQLSNSAKTIERLQKKYKYKETTT